MPNDLRLKTFPRHFRRWGGFAHTRKKRLKAFPAVRYFTRKLELLSNIPRAIVDTHQKMNIQAAPWVAERIKILDFRKLGNFHEIPKMLGIEWHVLNWQSKKNILTIELQNWKEEAVKHSIERSMLLNFVDLSTIFCGTFQLPHNKATGKMNYSINEMLEQGISEQTRKHKLIKLI